MSASAWMVALGLSLVLATAALAGPGTPAPYNAPRPTGQRHTRPAPREPFTSQTAPQAADPATLSPLAPFLARALDRALPAAGGGKPVNWTHEEVHDLAARVVLRINNRNPGLGLALVSFDAVTKTVDANGTLRYQFDAQVHALPRNLSARVTVSVDVTQDDLDYIRDISVHGARADASVVRGSGGLAGHVTYATYEPVITYEPRFD